MPSARQQDASGAVSLCVCEGRLKEILTETARTIPIPFLHPDDNNILFEVNILDTKA